MKGLAIVIMVLISYVISHAQNIKGRVFREGTDSAVVNASVYYSGSMSGTVTDQEGRFEIPAKQQQIPVTISCIGYQSSKINYQPGKPLIVHLKPKSEALKEVIIRVDGMNRRDEEALFIHEFIGLSTFALSCTIINIKDIDFFYSKKTHILSASCDKPIIIVNKKLGYKISYYLDKFEKTPGEVRFAGNYTFTLLPVVSKETIKINRNREEAYNGSRMQLIRALWRNTLTKTDLRLYTPYYEPVAANDIVITDSLNNKYIHFTGRLFVLNKNDTRQFNPLMQKEEFSYIDKDGFYGIGLLWSGNLGNQRVGDLLPFEYQSAIELKKGFAPDTVLVKPSQKANAPLADKISRQNLSEAERNFQIFKKLVLVPDNPINNQLVVKKWQRPINYRLYGTCGNANFDAKIAENVRGLFNRLSVYSGLPMREANPDSAGNFNILIGSLPRFKALLSKEVYNFFKYEEEKSRTSPGAKKSTGYFNWFETGFLNMVQLVETKNVGSNSMIWCQIKAQIMNGLGFFGQIGGNSNSLFYRGINYWTPEDGVEPFDQLMIKNLYQPKVRSGMTETELDAVLADKQL